MLDVVDFHAFHALRASQVHLDVKMSNVPNERIVEITETVETVWSHEDVQISSAWRQQ